MASHVDGTQKKTYIKTPIKTPPNKATTKKQYKKLIINAIISSQSPQNNRDHTRAKSSTSIVNSHIKTRSKHLSLATLTKTHPINMHFWIDGWLELGASCVRFMRLFDLVESKDVSVEMCVLDWSLSVEDWK